MSTFSVTVEKLATIEPHQNADRLEMAALAGKDFSFVVGKDEFTAGELIIYFPIDSSLPMSIVDALGLSGKLAHGKATEGDEPRLQNRVKTVKLRGNLSQGVVSKLDVLAPLYPDIDFQNLTVGDDLTDRLGVTKYEPPIVPSRYGNLSRLPDMVSVYDIESAQNYADIVEKYLTDTPVYISEKVEGSNWWATLDDTGQLRVGQRNYEIIDVVDYQHDWYKVLQIQGLEGKLQQLWEILSETYSNLQLVALRGEITGPGIQGNYYKLPNYRLFAFDIEVNSKPINAPEFLEVTQTLEIETVPILAEQVMLQDWLHERTIKEAADGQSAIYKVKREGIVIKPLTEQTDQRLGRVFVKQHSLAYLAKSKL